MTSRALSTAVCVLALACAASTQKANAELAVGIHEQSNPNLFWSSQEKPVVDGAFQMGREALTEIRPGHVRLMLNWNYLQKDEGAHPNWDLAEWGGMRGLGPNANFGGVREQLLAIRSQQREGRFKLLVVITGVPACVPRDSGSPGDTNKCEPRQLAPTSQLGLKAYGDFVDAFLDLAHQMGVKVGHIGAWNEPNHSYFLMPQRNECKRDSPSRSPEIYSGIVRELKTRLDRRPASERPDIVLGELAQAKGGPVSVSVVDFIRSLPQDVACAGNVWGQHVYLKSGAEGTDDPGDTEMIAHELDQLGCPVKKDIWITETGVGAPSLSLKSTKRRSADPEALKADCRLMHHTLTRWSSSSRVKAAFQYSFREDDRFPVGLLSTDLTTLYAPYYSWLAWGGKRAPGDPAPELPSQCLATPQSPSLGSALSDSSLVAARAKTATPPDEFSLAVLRDNPVRIDYRSDAEWEVQVTLSHSAEKLWMQIRDSEDKLRTVVRLDDPAPAGLNIIRWNGRLKSSPNAKLAAGLYTARVFAQRTEAEKPKTSDVTVHWLDETLGNK